MKKINLSYSGSTAHYPALDGLRGIAILLVLAFHVLDLPAGWMGVDLFFVISGFLIGSILIDTREKSYYFRNFYIKRVFRIFPLYYSVLIVVILFFAIADISFWKSGWAFFFYLQNIMATFLQFWPEGWQASLNHFWSLAIEEQFYLIFPLIVLLVSPRHLHWICLAGIIISILCRLFFYYHHNQLGTYVFTISRIDSLLCGVWAAIWVRKRRSLRIEFIILSVVLMAALLLVSTDLRHPVFQTIGFTVNAFFFSILLLMALSPEMIVSRFLQIKFFKGTGKISYGLYVFHYPFLILFEHIIPSSDYQRSLVIALTLVMTFSTAMLSFRFFESYFMELRRKYLH